jgi:2'-5' RNA ligase
MTKTHRLFIAIEVPDQIHLALKSLQSDFPDIKILPGAKAHLTLKFIGDFPDERLPELRRVLETIHGPTFEVTFSGLGTSRSGLNNLLWAGLTENQSLTDLHWIITDALYHQLSIAKSKRPMMPHITLARLKYRPGLSAQVKEIKKTPAPPFLVTSFGLYQSKLDSAGAIHTLLATYNLG